MIIVIICCCQYLFTAPNINTQVTHPNYQCIHPINAVTCVFITASIFLLIAIVICFLIRKEILALINDIQFKKTRALIMNMRYSIKAFPRQLKIIKLILEWMEGK